MALGFWDRGIGILGPWNWDSGIVALGFWDRGIGILGPWHWDYRTVELGLLTLSGWSVVKCSHVFLVSVFSGKDPLNEEDN